eukprot:gene3262-3573_t
MGASASTLYSSASSSSCTSSSYLTKIPQPVYPHWSTLETAEYYFQQSDYHQAKLFYQLALKEVEENSLDWLSVQNAIGVVAYRQDDLVEAEELLQDVHQMVLSNWDSRHPLALICQYNLGLVLMAAKRFSEAAKWFLLSYQGRQAVFGAKHPDTLAAFQFLSIAVAEAGDEDVNGNNGSNGNSIGGMEEMMQDCLFEEEDDILQHTITSSSPTTATSATSEGNGHSILHLCPILPCKSKLRTVPQGRSSPMRGD